MLREPPSDLEHTGGPAPVSLNAKQLAKKKTHRRLLDATIDLVREQGAGAVNTVRVTERAGVAQSVFYAHFESVAECLTEAATDVVERLDAMNTQVRAEQNLDAKSGEELLDLESMTDGFDRSLAIMVEHAEFVDIFVRFVRDPTALGEPLRASWRRMHDAFTDDLMRTGARVGLLVGRRQTSLLAEMVMGLTANATEALRAGRVRHRRELARMLAVMMRAAILEGQPASAPRKKSARSRAAR